MQDRSLLERIVVFRVARGEHHSKKKKNVWMEDANVSPDSGPGRRCWRMAGTAGARLTLSAPGCQQQRS